MARFFSLVNEDVIKYESALTWLLTCRGIPQIYYGDEIGLTGFTVPNDGHVRQDFPGGWANDAANKFTATGRNAREDSIWNYIAALANFRKNSSALITGKLMQYVPVDDGVYVYFRYDNKQTIMIAMNTSKETKTINPANYAERTKGFSKSDGYRMKNIITGEVSVIKDFSLGAKASGVWELIR